MEEYLFTNNEQLIKVSKTETERCYSLKYEVIKDIRKEFLDKLENKVRDSLKKHGFVFASQKEFLTFLENRCVFLQKSGYKTLIVDIKLKNAITVCSFIDRLEIENGEYLFKYKEY